MKDAWEAYFESVEGELGERPIPESLVDPESEESRAIVAAFETARIPTIDFLVESQNWSKTAAGWLINEFVKAGLDWLKAAPELGLAGLRVKLRHCYEDWLRGY